MTEHAVKSKPKDAGKAAKPPEWRPAPFAQSNGADVFLYRKASCACGGGCPSCQTNGLKVSHPNDAAEVEADRIAERVMRMADGPFSPVKAMSPASDRIHRKCSACEEEQEIQRKVENSGASLGRADSSSLIGGATRSGGRPLDLSTRGFFEPRFGYNFGGVRVHTDSRANAAANAVSARAYTLGSDIVFAAGRYAPGSPSGDRLLAHELAHVVQQDAGVEGKTIRRSPAKEITGGKIEKSTGCGRPGKAAAGPTAKDASHLTIRPIKNAPPCACLLVVHNNEENALKTADLMHQNCNYNLALVLPDTGKRCIKLPSHDAKDDFDPNEFFAPEIVKQCIDDESACRDYLNTKKDSTDKAEIDRYLQISFFLTVKDCSNSFSLPVIALHNNAVDTDTKNYLARKDAVGVGGLKNLDIEKQGKDTDEQKLKPLSDQLKKFGSAIKAELTAPRKTNIFRWCWSGELSACHIGDPDKPDNVAWVTNREDFKKLKATNVNVALQDDPARVGKESETDLSTLFLTLKTLMGAKLGPDVAKVTAELAALAADHKFRVSELAALVTSGGASSGVAALRVIVIQGIIEVLVREMQNKQAELDLVQKEFDKYAKNLHFLNIEGPIYSLAKQTDAGRIASYDMIATTLKALNLHCCGGKEAEAEGKIREGLTLRPPPRAKPKP